MHQYKHYSFDVWQTLIRRSNDYKEKREEYFRFYFAKKGRTLEKGELDAVMIEVWNYFDQHSKLFGKAPNPLEMYAMVIFRITGKLEGISMLEMQSLYKDLERLFLKYPPHVYDSDTIPVLEELKSRGKTLSILSNTSYIKGCTMRAALDKLGIGLFFQTQIYSDELGYSKPHEKCFRAVDIEAGRNYAVTEEVIHVGDKELEDGQGAYEAGFGYFIINSNSYTIKDLL